MTQWEIIKRQKATIEKLRKEAKELRKRVASAEFWGKFVYPEGAKPADIQNELLDYHEMLGEVGKVYDHVTGGFISKPNTAASAVIGRYEEHVQELIDSALKEYQQYVGEDEEESLG